MCNQTQQRETGQHWPVSPISKFVHNKLYYNSPAPFKEIINFNAFQPCKHGSQLIHREKWRSSLFGISIAHPKWNEMKDKHQFQINSILLPFLKATNGWVELSSSCSSRAQVCSLGLNRSCFLFRIMQTKQKHLANSLPEYFHTLC